MITPWAHHTAVALHEWIGTPSVRASDGGFQGQRAVQHRFCAAQCGRVGPR
jgi:hypothetical protein